MNDHTSGPTSAAAKVSARWLCVGLISAMLMGAAGCASGMRWNFDYSKAQQQAQRDNQPVLLYFWDWLSIDRSRMDSEVWSDPKVIAESRRVVVVPLEQGWFPDLARQYQVEATPTLVLLWPQGHEVSRLKGVPKAEDLVLWLQGEMARAASSQAAGKSSTSQEVGAASQP